MASFIELIAKIKQKNNGTFKLVDAQDVECEEGKGLDEVLNEKLDKNQGGENVGKTMVVGADGNLVVGDSSSKNVYTKEEVDYLLDDKMDKPYVPIEITDNATINDALEGNFKIDKIKGNTYQNVETDIVPTPQRPVPINSRKVLANGEYVELRSLKETGNIWDLKPFTDTNNVYYQSNDVETNCWATELVKNLQSILKPHTTYSIRLIVEMVHKVAEEGYTNASIEKRILLYRSQGETLDNVLVDLCMLTSELNDGETQTVTKTFTTPDDLTDCKILWYTERYTSESGPPLHSIVKFKDITLIEGDSVPDSYVAPTVRDYKIVDHATQTSKIVRNVNQFELPTDFSWNDTDYYPIIIGNVIPEDKKGVYDTRMYSLTNYTTEPYFGYSDTSGLYLRFSECDTYWKLNNSDEVNAFLTRIKEDGKPFIFQYQLAIPVEESITYVETDVSEVGYSWQDTTSPSPDVPSEIKGVEKIDILKTGKNLFDIKSHEFTTNLQNGKVSANRIVKVNDTTLRVQNPNVQSYAVGDKFVVKANEPLIISFDVLEITGTELINVVFYKETGSLLKSFECKTIKVGTRFVIDTPITTRNNYVYIGFQSVDAGSIVTISNILLEHASIATEYEPYKEQHINITPPQPLYENDIANVESGNYDYYLKQKTGNTLNNISVQLVKSKTALIVIPKVSNGFPQTQFSCDCNMFESKVGSISEQEDDEEFINSESSMYSIYINVKKDRLTTYDTAGAVEFITNPNMIISYPDTTPTTQPIPKEDLKLLKSLKIEQGVTNIFVGGEVKPTIEARYPQDLALVQQQLEQKILLISDSLIDTQAKVLLQGGN